MEIQKTPIGVLAMEEGKVVDKALFPRDPKAIAEKLKGEPEEEKRLRAKYPKAKEGEGRLDLAELAERLGFCKKEELGAIVSKVNEEMVKAGIRSGFGRDKLVVSAVRAQRHLEESVNSRW